MRSRPRGARAVVFSDMRRESRVFLRRIYRFLPRVRIAGRRSISSVFSRMNQLRFAAAGAHVRNRSDVGRAGSAERMSRASICDFFERGKAVEWAAAGGLPGPKCPSAGLCDSAVLKDETSVRHPLARGSAGRVRPAFPALLRVI